MIRYSTMRTYGGSIPLPTLKPGMVVVLYTDKGPSGPCGQGMSTTCPHATVSFFPDYDTMKEWLNEKGVRRGQQADLRFFVVDDYGDGQLNFNIHEGCA